MNNGSATPDDAIAQPVLAQAASWLMLMQEGPLLPAQQLELERWRLASEEHERAWKRAQRLLSRLGSLPPTLARPTLQRPSGRRAVLRGLVLLMGAVPLGWWGWRSQAGRFASDYQTAVGERKHARLADGTQIILNTDSALALLFDSAQRLLHLRRGEVYIVTAADPRPLKVQTLQGQLLALGTRFSVRQLADETLLEVYEGAVQVRPEGASPAAGENIIRAGQQVRFNRERLGLIEGVRDTSLAWQRGLLVADDMPLQQWAQALMRYADRRLECDPALGELRVSGTFPVDDLPLALAMLAQTYGLQVRQSGGQVIIGR
ncbi:MAG: FecR family protein [Candidatus Pseudomonas phytovorans]|uniref:FecR family protein n=1 Tax=Candidatus Pseudomonas phytovorans TaxID=3121377 RepID=A0AAJ6BDA0_9PSED|nr:FecR family protein [Pseudomonas sp.]WEK30516.1 MAG: FecR family protein [Pseudomonas sp.]